MYGCVPHHPRTSYRLGEVRRVIDEDEVEDEQEEHRGHGVGETVPANPDALKVSLTLVGRTRKCTSSTQVLQPLESAVPLRPWSDEKDDGRRK